MIRLVRRPDVALCLGILLVSLATLGATDGPVTEALLREIARIERDLARAASADERGPAEARLRRAAEAARRGRRFLALHDLSVPWRIEEAYTLSGTLAARVKTMDDFKREWMAAGEPGAPTPAPGLPLVVAALATSSESVGPATYRASLPYAEDAGLRAGLYYLGDARAAADFGAFCRTLKFESAGPRPVLRSIAAEMDRFERDVVKLYDKANATARRSFIVINVGLKIARERDSGGDYPAALLQYLLARYQLGLVTTKEASSDAPSRLAAYSKALIGADHSIAHLFFEMAATSLEAPDGARGATAIADYVLPEYVEILKK
jgi:hypothetical protein